MQTKARFPRIATALITVCALLATAACTPTRTQKSAGEQIDDTVITAKVKSALIADPETKARQIDVEVFRGTVQLNGFVDNAAEKSAAARNKGTRRERDMLPPGSLLGHRCGPLHGCLVPRA